MKNDGAPGRTYSEKEIGELIQRATQLHERSTGSIDRSLSLDEIGQVAAELGLPPEHLQAAAIELENRQSAETRNIWGGPFLVDHTQVVPGELSEDQWAEVVLALRRFTGRTGTLSDIGRAREWTHQIGETTEGVILTQTKVIASPVGAHTTIEVRKRFGIIAVWYPLVVIPCIIMAMIALNERPGPLTLFFSGVGILSAFAAVRAGISAWSGKQRARIQRVAENIQRSLALSRGTAAEVGSESAGVSEPVVAGGFEPGGNAPNQVELPEPSDFEENTGARDRDRLRG